MEHYAGIDVSLEQSSVCVVDATGHIVREAKVASEPEALIGFLLGLALPLARIGLEAGPLSQWLHAALVRAGFDAVLLETRHVKAALSAMIVKTDRRDARGIAQLLRMGWFRPVHAKSAPAQEVRALLVARKQLQAKMRDVELSLRGLLRGFGLKVGEISKGQFATRVRTLVAGHMMLERIADAMLSAREALRTEFGRLHRAMLAIVRGDEVCRRLMTAPGVGALIAVTFTSAVDDPERFARSRAVGAHFGLTPRKYQSGETDVTGAVGPLQKHYSCRVRLLFAGFRMGEPDALSRARDHVGALVRDAAADQAAHSTAVCLPECCHLRQCLSGWPARGRAAQNRLDAGRSGR